WRNSWPGWSRRGSPTAPMTVRITSASRSFRGMESFRRKTSAECSMEPAWTWTNTTRTALAISRCGRRPSRERLSGKPRLVLDAHKPSSIRYLLTSVPYRNQLNFTFDGLKQAAVSVERLRNFRQRLTAGNFPEGSNLEMQSLASETISRMRAALDDDLNTAQAQGAIFEMVRIANSALDSNQIKKDDTAPLLAPLEKFDEVFAVLN